jgi:hypothetical protein
MDMRGPGTWEISSLVALCVEKWAVSLSLF